LLAGVRGASKAPGEFRTTQNWIGGTRPGNARFVPPPAHEVLPAMGALELFLHDDPVETPILVKAALAHAQFETIHPFLDGNGRVGRLLITLLLCSQEVLSRPLLYLSLYLKRNRDGYYELLQRIRTDGVWEEWLKFFLEGVIEIADSATQTTTEVVRLIERDRRKLHDLGRGSAAALRVHDFVARYVLMSVPRAADELELSLPTVYKAVARLEEVGILREVTGRQRGRLYVYDEYLQLLNEGTTDAAP
jgi:Fic family protein